MTYHYHHLFVIVLGILQRKSFAANMACQEVLYAYSQRGMDVYELPLTPLSGQLPLLKHNYNQTYACHFYFTRQISRITNKSLNFTGHTKMR